MIDSDKYQNLMDALSKLFEDLPEGEGDDGKKKPKKGKSITVVTVSKAPGMGMKIPKALAKKGASEEEEEYA